MATREAMECNQYFPAAVRNKLTFLPQVRASQGISRSRNSSVGSVLGSLSCVMQRDGGEREMGGRGEREGRGGRERGGGGGGRSVCILRSPDPSLSLWVPTQRLAGDMFWWFYQGVSYPPTPSLAEWLRRPPPERQARGLIPACAGIIPGCHTSDFKFGTAVAILPGSWRYRVSAGTGWLGVSILWLGEIESLICNFYLSVAARIIVRAHPSLRCTCMLLGRFWR